MPKFTSLDPADVRVGRAKNAYDARQPYRDALTSSEAGRIELVRGDVPSTVKQRLSLAAREAGVRIRSSWEDKQQRALLWRKVER